MSLASVFLFFFVSVLARRLCVALSSFAYVVVAWIRITLMFPRVITLSFSFFCFFWKASNFRQTHRGAREAPLPTRSCIMNENLQILRRRWRRQFSFSFFLRDFLCFLFCGWGVQERRQLQKKCAFTDGVSFCFRLLFSF